MKTESIQQRGAVAEWVASLHDTESEQIFSRWGNLQSIHDHSMLAGAKWQYAAELGFTEEDVKQLNWWEAHQPLATRLDMVQQLMGNAVRFTGGSDHVAHPLYANALTHEDVQAIQRKAFAPEHIMATIAYLSELQLKRAAVVQKVNEHTPQVHTITGGEADIVGRNGLIDIDPRVTAQLEYVPASLHIDEYRAAEGTEQKDLRMKQVVETFVNVVQKNPIDTIAHPLRELPPEALEEFDQAIRELESAPQKPLSENTRRLLNLFTAMKQKQVTLEFNVADAHDPKRKKEVALTTRLARVAKHHGLLLSLGTDFHDLLNKYMPTELPDGTLQEGMEPAAKIQLQQLYQNTSQGNPSVKRGDRFSTATAARQYEQAHTAITHTLFNTPQEVGKLVKPFCIMFRRLEREGFTPADFVNSSPERLEKWLAVRKRHKQEFLSSVS